MGGAGRARLVRLLIGGVVTLLAFGGLAMLVSSNDRATVAETASGESAAPGKPAVEKPCDGKSGEGSPGSFIPNEDGIKFGSLDEMVATADLVTLGTVTEVSPREIEPQDGDGEPGLPVLDVMVSVDETLKGKKVPEALVTVKTLEFAYSGGDTEWRCPGERVLLFLSPSTEEPGFYTTVITNYSQSVYLLRNDKPEATVRDSLPDAVVRKVEALSVPELRREVGEAKEKIEKGEVKPLKREL